jgi:hypothetical protein
MQVKGIQKNIIHQEIQLKQEDEVVSSNSDEILLIQVAIIVALFKCNRCK